MPAIKDFAQNYSALTSATLLCPSPDVAENELLVALASSDTAATTLYWMGGEACTSAHLAVTGGTAFTNYTTAFNDPTASDFFLTMAAGTDVVNNAFYVGHTTPFNAVSVQQTAESAAVAIVRLWEYSKGSGTWGTLTTLVTGIIPVVTVGTHAIMFNPPADWATDTVNSVANTYWVRWRVTTGGTITTRMTCTQGWVGKWNQLYHVANSTTSDHAILYKIASASEPEEYAIHDQQATNDTKNALVVSIKDVDTLLPFAHETTAALSNPVAGKDADLSLYSGAYVGAGQSFVSLAAPPRRLASVTFSLKKVGAPTGNITAKLYTQAAGVIPTTPVLAISNTYNIVSLTDTYQLIEFTFPWYFHYLWTASTTYVVTIEYSGGDVNNYLHIGRSTTAAVFSTGNGSTLTGTTWSAQTWDLIFYVKYFAFNTSTSATGRTVLPTMTAERNNSLLLYSTQFAAAAVPSIIEGPVTLLAAKDGTTHSDGMSWGFQATLGTTPANVYCTALGASWTATFSVASINPPSTGATVIPPYCSSDSSVYISPCSGAVYLTDSAAVTTCTAIYGTSLNGKTLTNTGTTTTTLADTGLNSYHAMRQLTGITTAKTWCGSGMTIASRNMASKNLLFHIQPSLPVHIQTTDAVTLDGACGIAIGLCSTAASAYKVWHVGGANTAWGVARHVPVIINTDYTGAGMIQNTGSLNAGAIVNIGFMMSAKVAAPAWLMGSIWALDTTVVAGGNVAYPLDIPGIVQAAATGHERKSVLVQGNGQMLVLQPLQIGDGGTNPVYLELDATAIEFPRQYDKTAKAVFYNSINNVAGLKYYGGASDTIIHRNSVISSPSRYHWGLHLSHNAACTYGAGLDLSGLSVIGAGTITLGITTGGVKIDNLTINDYSTITATGLTLTNSTILMVPATTNDSITLNTSSNIDYCNIDVSNLTAGYYWCSTTDLTIFTYTTFTGKATTNNAGHAIRISTLGAPTTFNIYGLTFTDFGADGTTSAAILNDSGRAVTINVFGGGNTPTYKNLAAGSTTTIVAGLVSCTVTIKDISGNNLQDIRVLVLAAAGGPMPFETVVTATASGTTATITHATHGMATNDYVTIKGADQQEYNGVHQITRIDAGSYSYTMSGSPVSPATGTLKATYTALSGLTDVNGQITMTRVFSSNQPITGRARKGSAAPFYKTADFSGTINSSTGFSTTVQMIPD